MDPLKTDKPSPSYEDDPLWQKIRDFVLDDPDSAFPFTRRLARENRWTLGFAIRVVREYRRFLFLSKRAGHVVSPSDEVDQAWHLHLIYTRSYWDELCRDVLESPLHHGPTRGGQDESMKFHELYERTKASYERIFGQTPPPDIWPPTAERFVSDGVRIRQRDVWVVRKPWMPRR